MADEEFPEDEDLDVEMSEDLDPDELDEEALEDEEPFDLDDDNVLDTDQDVDEEEEEEEERPRPAPAPRDDEDDDEDLVDPDDVEADLDTILKDRLVAADDEADEDDEEELEVDDRGDPVDRIQPRRPGEFVCQSCFLVKHPGQLADPVKLLCLDCV